MKLQNRHLIENMIALYNRRPPFTIESMATVYTDDVTFMDPVHTLHGLPALCRCLDRQYANLTECRFIPQAQWQDGDHLFLQWDLHAAHPALAGGQRMTVNGFSILQQREGKLCFHRDIYDLGQMLYEQVPLLGTLNRKLKQRIARCGE